MSPEMNFMHYDVTRQCIGRGLSIKKAVILLEQFLGGLVGVRDYGVESTSDTSLDKD